MAYDDFGGGCAPTIDANLKYLIYLQYNDLIGD